MVCVGLVQVSWIRLRDTSLLTVGGYTYTSDLRFESAHTAGSPDWRLVIRNASVADTGMYECQAATQSSLGSPRPNLQHSLVKAFISHNNIWQISSALAGEDVASCCQVSTTPHMSRQVSLTVRAPRTALLGGPDMFVDSGSLINLTCRSAVDFRSFMFIFESGVCLCAACSGRCPRHSGRSGATTPPPSPSAARGPGSPSLWTSLR